MIIAAGKLQLLPQDRYARRRGIDQFFSSLAEDCGHKAIGVVLSGAMSDGTLGLEAIKAAGGITFAQNESAQHDSMPRSAVASGCVDFVLPPQKIAEEIARIARHPHIASETEVGAETLGHTRIAQIVHRATGVDFIHYKANTLLRRITRRMVLHKMETLKDYETHLERTPGEVEALFQDILISVTTFFRDPDSFDALARTVFPKLLTGRTRQEPVRIWTLGCSTGEEAYSVAMVFMECAEAVGSDVPMQLFATDLNSACVGKARAGVYSTSIDQSVSPARLERFFVKDEAGYRICKEVRERCIFSRHNALSDPPFSRIDLISCRNMLIYMEPVLQRQILSLLHYALKPGGYLWLGRSETTGASRALFHVEDARNKLFTRRPGRSPPGVPFRPAHGGGGEPFQRAAPAPRETARADLPKEAERILLSKYTPPGVIISTAMEIVQFRGETGAFLAPAAGAPSLHLLKMLREGLLVGVRAAILRAGAEGRTVREEGLRVRSEGGVRELAVEVVPINAAEAKDSGFLVLFDEVGNSNSRSSNHWEQAAANADRQTAVSDDELVRITQELAATREYLQSVVEQQDAANEELQSANEEAQSANEEMQSVNEELETSKEEIQSSNEELATVNDELNNRNLELNRVNNTLQRARDFSESIVANMRSPLVVLDAALRVKTASAAFYETFNMEPAATEGQLIYNLDTGKWNIPALRTLLEELLPKNSQIDDYEVRHAFKESDPRIMILNAQRLARHRARAKLTST
jgi:two-component system, chemotaxis family, CheB/CheR fusion protein